MNCWSADLAMAPVVTPTLTPQSVVHVGSIARGQQRKHLKQEMRCIYKTMFQLPLVVVFLVAGTFCKFSGSQNLDSDPSQRASNTNHWLVFKGRLKKGTRLCFYLQVVWSKMISKGLAGERSGLQGNSISARPGSNPSDQWACNSGFPPSSKRFMPKSH